MLGPQDRHASQQYQVEQQWVCVGSLRCHGQHWTCCCTGAILLLQWWVPCISCFCNCCMSTVLLMCSSHSLHAALQSPAHMSSYILACAIYECIESNLQLHLQVLSPVVPKTMLHNMCRCCLTSVGTLPSQKCCYRTAPSGHDAALFPLQDSTCALCKCQELGSMLWHGRREASELPWQ